MGIKEEWIEYLKSISTKIKDDDKCIFTTWLLENGEMYEIQGSHDAVAGFLSDINNFKRIEKPIDEPEIITFFAINTNAIRLACYPNEVTVELKRKQNLPTENQIKTLKRIYCDDNDKKYLQYQFSEHFVYEDGVIVKDQLKHKKCDRVIDDIIKKFREYKEKK